MSLCTINCFCTHLNESEVIRMIFTWSLGYLTWIYTLLNSKYKMKANLKLDIVNSTEKTENVFMMCLKPMAREISGKSTRLLPLLFPSCWFPLLLIEFMGSVPQLDLWPWSTGWNDVQLQLFTLRTQEPRAIMWCTTGHISHSAVPHTSGWFISS